MVFFRHEAGDLLLNQHEIGLSFQHLLHSPLVAGPVHLRPRRHNRGALGRIQHAELNHMKISQAAHLSTQGIDLPHHLPLGRTADIGIAGEIGQAVQGHGEKDDPPAQSGGRQRRLTASVPCADHDDIGLASGKSARLS